jgi:hypothetical protein
MGQSLFDSSLQRRETVLIYTFWPGLNSLRAVIDTYLHHRTLAEVGSTIPCRRRRGRAQLEALSTVGYTEGDCYTERIKSKFLPSLVHRDDLKEAITFHSSRTRNFQVVGYLDSMFLGRVRSSSLALI